MGKRKASDFEVRGPDSGYDKSTPRKYAGGGSYADKLRDPRWQKKRLEIMERDGFACRECGDKDSPLNVHHGYYARGRSPWEYPDEHLKTLCEECHREHEESREELLGHFVQMSLWQQADLALIAAIARQSNSSLAAAGVGPGCHTQNLQWALDKSADPASDYQAISWIISHWEQFSPAIHGIVETFIRTSENASQAMRRHLQSEAASGKD